MKKRPGPKSRASTASGGEQRLQKALASAGLGSRRACEELITTGRVEIDRETVTELGTKVDPNQQEIRVDGETLKFGKRVYYAVHKPQGVVTTHRDQQRRPRVIDLVPPTDHPNPVGRLDAASEGLILLTNDGDLANRLAHPRYGVQKTYHVHVAGDPTPETIGQMKQGVHLAEGFVRPKELRRRRRHKKATVLEIVLDEGKNREIRRMMAALGHKVLRLVRVAFGPVRLGDLPKGAYRELTGEELEKLRLASGDATATPKRRRSGKRPPAKAAGRSEGAGRKPKGPQERPLSRPPSGGAIIGGDVPPPETLDSESRPQERPRRRPGPRKKSAGPAGDKPRKRPAKKRSRRRGGGPTDG